MLLFSPFRWTDEGIVFDPSGSEAITVSDLLILGGGPVELGWDDSWSIEVKPTWPCVELSWRDGTAAVDARRGRMPDPRRFAERLGALVAHIEARSPSKLKARGWLDVPEVPWEPVSALPELPRSDAVGEGAFRSSARPVEDLAVAVRAAPGRLSALLERALRWDSPWLDHAREVRIGALHLYIARAAGVHRIPLSSLRERQGAVYVFGRSTMLVLTPRRQPCPVRRHLDALLERDAHP